MLWRNLSSFLVSTTIVQLRNILSHSITVSKLELVQIKFTNSENQIRQWLVLYIEDFLCLKIMTATIDVGRLNTVSKFELDSAQL